MLVYEGKTKLFDHSYTKELSYIIKKSYEEGKVTSHTTNFSYKLEKFLTQHKIFEILDIINCIFSMIVTIFYICQKQTLNYSYCRLLTSDIEKLVPHFRSRFAWLRK